MNFSMKAFLITWLTFLGLLSLILTGAFYLAAHGNEFGSTTITNSTTYTPTTTFISESMSSNQTAPTFHICYKSTNSLGQEITTCLSSSTSSTSESSRTISDYGQLGIILTIVLIAVLVIIAVLRRHYRK